MSGKNKNVFLIFFAFSAVLFLSFEAFHLYLIRQTESFLREFSSQRIQGSIREFELRLVQQNLFKHVSGKADPSDLLSNHFHREMTSIEREFELKAFVLFDADGNLLLGSETSRLFLKNHQFDPLKPELPSSYDYVIKKLKTEDNYRLQLISVLPVPLSQVNHVQKSYLKLGFFFFLALLSGALFIVWELIRKLSSLEDESQRSKRLAQFGSLAAGVAHDIRNPLSILGLQLQELREMHLGDPESVNLVNRMGKAIKRIDHTVASLLIFGRESLPFNEPILIDDIIAEILGQEDLGNMELSVYVPRVILHGNHDLIYRMFENLLRNASEAVGHGSVKVSITGEIKGSNMLITIEDDGPGLENPDRVFNEFYTTKSEGTGLGLLVVRDAIERHNGSVECTSRPDRGTSFRIVLPIT